MIQKINKLISYFSNVNSKNCCSFNDFPNLGSASVEMEDEPEDETEASEKNGVDKTLQKTEIQNNDEQHPHSAPPITPLRFCRFTV